MLPENSVIDNAVVGAAAWMLVDGRYDLRVERAQTVLRKDNLAFFLLQDLPPFVPRTAGAQ